jgi:hypothetical protein
MRVRLLALLGVLVIAGCAAAPASDAHSAPPPATAGPAGPAGSPGAPVAPAVCRLPVASGDAPVDGRAADGTAGHGGFVQFPQGAFSADPASLGSYDRFVGRWLPAARAIVAPDGTRYAWTDAAVLHVVDASSGADHPLPLAGPSLVVSFENEGVYVARAAAAAGAAASGLALVDPASGATRQITTDGTWSAIGTGVAFGQAASTSGSGAIDRVRRLDLASGAVTDVASYPGSTVRVLGAMGATPLIAVATGATYTLFAGASTTLFSGAVADSNPTAPVVVDGTTVWFSSLNAAVWHWDGNGPATRVADLPLKSVQIAGACR